MLIEPTGIKNLEIAQRQQLQVSPKRSGLLGAGPMRLALAGTLVAWARRLAPELSPATPVRQVATGR